MRELVEILTSKPSFRLGAREDIHDPNFLRAYVDATGRSPTALCRLVHRKIPPELIHVAYYVEFDTDDQMEKFLSLWWGANSSILDLQVHSRVGLKPENSETDLAKLLV